MALNRVTHERLEDGIVVSGTIQSAETWTVAYRKSLEAWQYAPIIAELLLHDMELIFDVCEKAEDLEEHNDWIHAAWRMIQHLDYMQKPPEEIERLKKYEADIRSGAIFKDDEPLF